MEFPRFRATLLNVSVLLCGFPVVLQLEFPIEQLQSSLLRWYGLQGRQLPWRSNASQTVSPYAIWVSEIMLQQTQVKTVIPYFARWLAQFPTVAMLAQAEQQAVLMQWQGLGYYARARNLHRAAQLVMTQHQGLVPQDFENLLL
jgi:A/G-specific adenine glycosylase